MKTVPLQKAEGMNSKIEGRKHKRKVQNRRTKTFLEDSEEGGVQGNTETTDFPSRTAER